jgi:catechol-2,3-dioxygenase
MMATKKLYPPGIFGVYLQVRDLDRSLSFYREALGLKVDWNDGTLAVLGGPYDTGDMLVIRVIDESARHHIGETGVTRLFWRVSDPVDLDAVEERLTRDSVPYQRHADEEIVGITTRDPDGTDIVLLRPDKPPLTGAPPPALYWQH